MCVLSFMGGEAKIVSLSDRHVIKCDEKEHLSLYYSLLYWPRVLVLVCVCAPSPAGV